VRCGWARIYSDPHAFGAPYLLLSGLILLLAHDTWFYWTHRLLHSAWLFRWAHRTHHLSIAPTPWAAYSFAPAEAVSIRSTEHDCWHWPAEAGENLCNRAMKRHGLPECD